MRERKSSDGGHQFWPGAECMSAARVFLVRLVRVETRRREIHSDPGDAASGWRGQKGR